MTKPLIKWDLEYHENGEVKTWKDKRTIKPILLAFLKMIEDGIEPKRKNN